MVGGGESNLPRLGGEPRRKRGRGRRTAPLAPGETLDPNRSGEEELDRLPGLAPPRPGLVTYREEEGGFWRARGSAAGAGDWSGKAGEDQPLPRFLRWCTRGSHGIETGRRRRGDRGMGSAAPAGISSDRWPGWSIWLSNGSEPSDLEELVIPAWNRSRSGGEDLEEPTPQRAFLNAGGPSPGSGDRSGHRRAGSEVWFSLGLIA